MNNLRRIGALLFIPVLGVGLMGGCSRAPVAPSTAKAARPVQVWGRQGAQPGQFMQPRAIAVAPNGFVYVVDITSRIQKWTTDGQLLAAWRAPKLRFDQNEGPEGVVVLRDGNIAFTNTHESRILIYAPTGKLLRSFGSYGTGRGQFLLVTGICTDADGFLYAADYGGDFDRVSKWTPTGKLVASWSGHGEGPRQFRRPCGLAISREGDLLVADINNHRIQRLDRKTGAFKGAIGARGHGDGQLNYPYGVAVDATGNIYVAEYGNHRVQKLSPQGKFLGKWGGPGHAVGQLANPRGIAVDRDGTVYVADTMNHRVQKFRF
jgi:sugar lactone lactonase YvrE